MKKPQLEDFTVTHTAFNSSPRAVKVGCYDRKEWQRLCPLTPYRKLISAACARLVIICKKVNHSERNTPVFTREENIAFTNWIWSTGSHHLQIISRWQKLIYLSFSFYICFYIVLITIQFFHHHWFHEIIVVGNIQIKYGLLSWLHVLSLREIRYRYMFFFVFLFFSHFLG